MYFFSVVIPTYNRALFISKTIDSVLDQTFKDFEIVVVNDGSTDNTLEVLEEYNGLEGFSVFTHTNSERGASRNQGIKLSKGRYVVFLDSDDLLKDTHLETLHKHILANNYPNFIANKYLFKLEDREWKNKDLSSLHSGYHSYKTFLRGNMLACMYACKRENDQLAYFQEDRSLTIMEDWIFLLENLREDTIYISDDHTSFLVDHEQRSMRKDHTRVIMSRLKAMEWVKENLSLPMGDFRTLSFWSHYFCSVHYYIDGNTKMAFKYYWKLWNGPILSKVLIVHFIRLMIGQRLISKLRS